MQSTLTWSKDMAFVAELDGFSFEVDAADTHGGTGRGPRPKTMVLTALAGCTAMDVISIVRKMRMEPARFSVTADGELCEGHPKVFTHITLRYHFEGGELQVARLRKAIELSTEQYCGVHAMLRPTVAIGWELWLDGALVDSERAAA